MIACKFCDKTLGKYNKTGVCRGCQANGLHYDCAAGCGAKITHGNHVGSGLCKACYGARIKAQNAEKRGPVMTEKERLAVIAERRRIAAHWPLGKPRGKAVRCPLGRYAAEARAQFSTPERAMYAAMIRAGVALGDPAEDRVTSSHRPSRTSPAAQVAGAFGGRG